ncbi:MAG: hypothetical protein IKU03_04590 [Bacteroidales bacterium]|nr:hypothetical protein [Bacteroidales bacterium]
MKSNRFFVWSLTISLLCTSSPLTAQNDTIPFLYRGHLYFNATLNDTVSLDIIYDTGGSNVFGVDSVWLAHSDWTPKHLGTARAGGGAGSMLVPLIMDSSKVTIGNIQEHYDIVPVFKLRDVVDCHIDGISGIKGIDNQPLEIDFEHNLMIKHKNGLPSTKGYKKIPIRYGLHRIYIWAETKIGGTLVKGWYMMDTGSGGTVSYTAQAARQFQLDTISGKRYICDVAQFGLGDKKQEYIVYLPSDYMVIGDDTIQKMPISYIPEGVGAFGNMEYLGVIGNAIWSRYNIIIDAENEMLYLRRFKEFTPIPTYDYTFRNRTDICKGWLVSSLFREGDAANAGMALEDTIISINGRNVTDYSWEEEWDIDIIPVQVLDIIGADGQEKHITLEAKQRW